MVGVLQQFFSIYQTGICVYCITLDCGTPEYRYECEICHLQLANPVILAGEPVQVVIFLHFFFNHKI